MTRIMIRLEAYRSIANLNDTIMCFFNKINMLNDVWSILFPTNDIRLFRKTLKRIGLVCNTKEQIIS